MRTKIRVFIFLVILLAIPIFIYYQLFIKTDENPLHIAVIGPISGNGYENGVEQLRGVQMYVNEVNNKGGIAGRKVKLDIVDDKNDPIRAVEKAYEIVDMNQALTVIGHNYSSCSVAAGEVYKKYGIPAISPSSDDFSVTANNDWYFITTANNNMQGQFLAHSINLLFENSFFKKQTVSIVAEEERYGDYLAKVFKEKCLELGLEIVYEKQLVTVSKNIDNQIDRIVTDLQLERAPGVLFLAMHATEGIKLVKALKDAGYRHPILGPSSFASSVFIDGFKSFPKEQFQAGYYTEGVYVTSPLIFDTASEEAQKFSENYEETYKTEPAWHAAAGYDAAMVVINAIENAGISGEIDSLKSDQLKIRNYLANINSIDNAIKGITGFNYFDNQGNMQKPISVGVFRRNNIISALTQLRVIHNFNEIPDLEDAIFNKKILEIDDNYMFKTSVVYSGIKINEISNLNIDSLTCFVDFNIWFRYRGDIEPENIIFLNAIDEIKLESPVETDSGSIQYCNYRVKASFKMDFMNENYSFGKHEIGFNFRHRELSRNNLIYVVDILGMGKDLKEKLKTDQVLSSIYGWNISNAWVFQDIDVFETQGHPNFLDIKDHSISYSRFNFGVLITEDSFNIRGLIPLNIVFHILIFSFLVLVSIFLLRKIKSLKKYKYIIWFFQLLFAFIFFISAELLIVENVIDELYPYHIVMIMKAFDVILWLTAAYFVKYGIDIFIWESIENSTGKAIPNLVRTFIAIIIYMLFLFAIIAFVFDEPITSLLATSGVFAMIIGLAIQMNIANIFSGIAVNAERPFRIGDWIQIADLEEAKVVNVNWRSTRLQTRDGNIISVPNNFASESCIVNYNYPDDFYKNNIEITVNKEVNEEQFKELIINAITNSEGVSEDPRPKIVFKTFNDNELVFAAYFWMSNYDEKPHYIAGINKNIKNALEQAGISAVIN